MELFDLRVDLSDAGLAGRMAWNSVQALFLAILVLLVQGALGKWLTPAWRHALWWIVLVRLLLPVAPRSEWSVFNVVSVTPADSVVESVDDGTRVRPEPADPGTPNQTGRTMETVHRSLLAGPLLAIPPEAVNAKDMVRSRVSPDLTPMESPDLETTARPVEPWLFWAWLAGTGLCLLRMVLQSLRFSQRLRTSMRPADPALETLLQECQSAMGIRRRVALLQGPGVTRPMLYGLSRPRLLLPCGLTKGWSAPELRHVFLHELAHLRRWDVPVNALMALLQAVYWFNPLIPWVFRRMRGDREMAADACALRSAGEGEARAYGLTIVRWLESWSRGESSGQPRAVGILDEAGQVERRIRAIDGYRHPAWWSNAGGVLLAALGAVSWTDARLSGEVGVLPISDASASGAPESANDPAAQAADSDPYAIAVDHLERARESKRDREVGGSLPTNTPVRLPLSHVTLWDDSNQQKADPWFNHGGWASTRPAADAFPNQPGVAKIRERLETIRFDELAFEDLPLAEVVRFLVFEAARRDPGGVGVNFLMTNPALPTGPKVAVDPNTGQTITLPAPPLGPIQEVLIRIDPPLKDLSLGDALDAITRSASEPIEATIEPYAVVFSRVGTRQRDLLTRVFRVHPDRFRADLADWLGPVVDAPAGGIQPEVPSGPTPNETSTGARSFAGGTQSLDHPREDPRYVQGRLAQERLRRFLEQLGVSLAPPNAVFYKDRMGLLMIRATSEEMEIVEKAIETLNAEPSDVSGVESDFDRRAPASKDSKTSEGSSVDPSRDNLDALRVRLAEERAVLAGLQTRYREKWPPVQEARARIAELERQIEALEASGGRPLQVFELAIDSAGRMTCGGRELRESDLEFRLRDFTASYPEGILRIVAARDAQHAQVSAVLLAAQKASVSRVELARPPAEPIGSTSK